MPSVQGERQQRLHEFALLVLIAISIVIAAVLLMLFLWHAVWVLMIIFAGVLLAVALRALADLLGKATGLSNGWALAAVLVLLGAIGIGGGMLAAAPVTEQVGELVRRLPESIQTVREWLSQYQWGRWLLYWSPPVEMVEKEMPNIVNQATGVLYSTIGAVAAVVIILFVGLYLAADVKLYTNGVLRLVPLGYRPRMAEILGSLGITLRRWLLGQFITMTFVGVLTFVGLWLLDVPLAFILALLAFVLEFVPNFGPIIAAVPAVLIAFVQSPELGLWVLALYFVIQQAESYLVTPLIQRQAVSLPPALTITAQVLLGILVGPIGLLLATPLTAVVVVLVKMLYVEDALGDRIDTPQLELTEEQIPELPKPETDDEASEKRRERQARQAEQKRKQERIERELESDDNRNA